MRKIKSLLIMLLALACVGGAFKLGMMAGTSRGEAASVTAGSSGDPLVTKSYLDSRLSGTAGLEGNGMKKVTLSKGQVLTGRAGTKIVLYSGSAEISGSTGLVNLSTGEMFKKSTTAVKYNMFLSPDKSGLKATAKCVVYISGTYSIS
ncbi:MAG: hypothetical protein K6G65_04390 [Lachnospiraceae bacterium]|nr:hypothetical protein [Lachnospiraceae bacterium]